MPKPARCGSWSSPITAHALTAGQISVSEPRFDRGTLCWLEGRPSEGGRSTVMCCGDAGRGAVTELLPSGVNVRTRVHEYGGGAWTCRGGTVFFSDFATQRLFRSRPDGEPRAITPEPPAPGSIRYADPDVTADGDWMVAVRERHSDDGQVANDIVILPTDGRLAPRSLASGHDFFSFPRISPDGRRLVWTTWDHPRMPWDGTDLWMAELGTGQSLSTVVHIAGGPDECVFQPSWRTSESIVFVSDRTGWSNLYSIDIAAPEAVTPLLPMEAEFGYPQWVFAMSRYAFLDRGERLVASYTMGGRDHLTILDIESRRAERWDAGYSTITGVATDGHEKVAVVGGTPIRALELACGAVGSDLACVRETGKLEVDGAFVSRPEHVEFPTGSGRSAYAFFYPPRNPECVPMPDERPPLIVTSHGGPTTATTSVLNLAIQFWTSRGFAVVDVNYSGSTGYGRAYAERLRGEWGVLDVADCVAAARFFASRGDVDPRRMAIRGKSASGLTALCALVFHDVFRVGASYYGVADLEGLVRDTHKFESRYLDSLIGPYPEAADAYRRRSPLENAGQLQTPVIFFQGLEDRVVPPSQAEALIRVLDARGLPYAYLEFEGEQHGFRRAETVRRSLEAELYFYSRMLGFEAADAVDPVPVANL